MEMVDAYKSQVIESSKENFNFTHLTLMHRVNKVSNNYSLLPFHASYYERK